MFQVVVWPGRVGSNDFLLRLTAGDGSLPRAKEAILALNLPERGIETAGAQGRAGPGRLLDRF
jgi:copper transport protein